MYVELIVRDKCERLVRTKALEDVQEDFTTGSREVYQRK